MGRETGETGKFRRSITECNSQNWLPEGCSSLHTSGEHRQEFHFLAAVLGRQGHNHRMIKFDINGICAVSMRRMHVHAFNLEMRMTIEILPVHMRMGDRRHALHQGKAKQKNHTHTGKKHFHPATHRGQFLPDHIVSV